MGAIVKRAAVSRGRTFKQFFSDSARLNKPSRTETSTPMQSNNVRNTNNSPFAYQ